MNDKKVWIHKRIHIERLYPSGYYEAYIIDRFYKADTLRGMKSWITELLKKEQ